MTPRPTAVIDTNVLLDWLVFRDPRVDALAAAVSSRRLRWLACPAMRAELARLLVHARLAAWSPDAGAALSRFDALVEVVADPPPGPVGSPRCSDPDDQVFVDLALQQRADWLLSHDRALLKLASRARRLGLAIATPAGWIRTGAAAPDAPDAPAAADDAVPLVSGT